MELWEILCNKHHKILLKTAIRKNCYMVTTRWYINHVIIIVMVRRTTPKNIDSVKRKQTSAGNVAEKNLLENY